MCFVYSVYRRADPRLCSLCRPIVEIAKTPGRQKSAKKTRSRAAMVAASAAKIKALNDGVCVLSKVVRISFLIALLFIVVDL